MATVIAKNSGKLILDDTSRPLYMQGFRPLAISDYGQKVPFGQYAKVQLKAYGNSVAVGAVLKVDDNTIVQYLVRNVSPDYEGMRNWVAVTSKNVGSIRQRLLMLGLDEQHVGSALAFIQKGMVGNDKLQSAKNPFQVQLGKAIGVLNIGAAGRRRELPVAGRCDGDAIFAQTNKPGYFKKHKNLCGQASGQFTADVARITDADQKKYAEAYNTVSAANADRYASRFDALPFELCLKHMLGGSSQRAKWMAYYNLPNTNRRAVAAACLQLLLGAAPEKLDIAAIRGLLRARVSSAKQRIFEFSAGNVDPDVATLRSLPGQVDFASARTEFASILQGIIKKGDTTPRAKMRAAATIGLILHRQTVAPGASADAAYQAADTAVQEAVTAMRVAA